MKEPYGNNGIFSLSLLPNEMSFSNVQANGVTLTPGNFGYSVTVSSADVVLTATGFTLNGFTLWKDGSWNTLCLPFALSSFTGTPLEGATVKTLDTATFSGGTLTLNFTDDLTSIEAGKPYIVKWPAQNTTIQNPEFNNVTITSNTPTNIECDAASFCGLFSPLNINEADNTMLYLGADNKLYWPNAAMTIGAYHAYFQLKGITAGDPEHSVRAFVLNFGDDSEANEITTTDFTYYTDKAGAWYDMQGRLLNGKPSHSGLYINNGKKVVVK